MIRLDPDRALSAPSEPDLGPDATDRSAWVQVQVQVQVQVRVRDRARDRAAGNRKVKALLAGVEDQVELSTKMGCEAWNRKEGYLGGSRQSGRGSRP